MTIYTLLLILGFLFVAYRIKNIPEEFSMSRELAVIMVIIIFQFIVYLTIVMLII